jgi:hypothetical protein
MSLFQKPRGTKRPVIYFDDDDSQWRRRNVDFEQRRKRHWFFRMPLLVQINVVAILGAVSFIIAAVGWFILSALAYSPSI